MSFNREASLPAAIPESGFGFVDVERGDYKALGAAMGGGSSR